MKTKKEYQPKTGESCGCRSGIERDNCPTCEGTGMRIDFKAIRDRKTKKAKGIPCSNMREFDAVMEPQHTPTTFKLIPGEMGLVSSPERKAYIVRAVNAHQELISLLNEVRDFHSGGLPSDFVTRMDSAIAKAEGK